MHLEERKGRLELVIAKQKGGPGVAGLPVPDPGAPEVGPGGPLPFPRPHPVLRPRG